MPSHSDAKEYDKLARHVICPHCWHRFGTADIVWIAQHEDLRGDPIVGADAFLRFRASRFDTRGTALDARGLPCEDLACPHCHLLIPRALLEGTPLIFSMIGVEASGKSYFLASLTYELRRLLPLLFSISFTDVDPVSNAIINGYEETLFRRSDHDQWVYLEKTQLESALYDPVQLAGQQVRLPHPFLFTLRPTGAHPNAQSAEQMSRVLCFYDNAGEHFLPVSQTDSAAQPGTQHVASP